MERLLGVAIVGIVFLCVFIMIAYALLPGYMGSFTLGCALLVLVLLIFFYKKGWL